MSYNEAPEEYSDYPSADYGGEDCGHCDHSVDLPPEMVLGENDLYCDKHHCAVDPCHSCPQWWPKDLA